jgi:hypothetical protein
MSKHPELMTAHDYMLAAKVDIENLFGREYAVKHSELVAAYMHVVAYDLRTMLEDQDREETPLPDDLFEPDGL